MENMEEEMGALLFAMFMGAILGFTVGIEIACIVLK